MKQFVIPRSMIFEQLGILCTAPIDGHDIGLLKETLASVMNTDVPVLVHVVTRKGAGYAPAVQNPEKFHGIAPFDIATGDVKKKAASAPSYTSVFGKALAAEARRDERIVAITAAMKGGTGLDAFAEEFPDDPGRIPRVSPPANRSTARCANPCARSFPRARRGRPGLRIS